MAALLAFALLAGCSGGGAKVERSSGDEETRSTASTAATAEALPDQGSTTTVTTSAPTPGPSAPTTRPPTGSAGSGTTSTSTAGADVEPVTAGAGRLTEVSAFGSNPGNVRMFEYVPVGLGAGRPLVVVLHGCTQSAAGFDDESGWTALADRQRFSLVFPEQPAANNSSGCWNFFLPAGNQREEGEPLSIKQMVDWSLEHRRVDAGRVFVTGLSAGAAMTNVMLATYPDVFAAGAPVAGVAFKCATNAAETVPCNQGAVDRTPKQWGDLVRGASAWTGPWPRVSVWHGTNDGTVSVQAMGEIVDQWTDVHGTDQVADLSDAVAGYPHRVYRDSAGVPVVETFSVTGMGHGWPIDPHGNPPCGTPAAYFLDVHLCAAGQIAAWFGLAG